MELKQPYCDDVPLKNYSLTISNVLMPDTT